MTENILSKIHIDRRNPVPIYQQLQEQLERLISNGTWRPREPLPSENTLANRLQISVMTVRQAMTQLVNQGLVFREKGRGTFIAPRPLDHRLHRLESFSEDMRSRGLVPSSQTLTFEIVSAPEAVASRLALASDAEVLHVKRLRLADGHPVALHDTYVSRLDLEREELESVGSLYTLLEQRGVDLMEAEETLEAIIADRETASLLEIERGAPLLKALRLSWDRFHVPFETVRAVYRADFYRYAVRLRR